MSLGPLPPPRPVPVSAGVVMLVIGALVAGVLPFFVPKTPGSPGTIAMMLLLWIFGGGMILAGLLVIAVAVFRGKRKEYGPRGPVT